MTILDYMSKESRSALNAAICEAWNDLKGDEMLSFSEMFDKYHNVDGFKELFFVMMDASNHVIKDMKD